MRVLLVAAMVLAGCAAPADVPDSADAPNSTDPPVGPAWELELGTCTAVSGVSVYPRDPYAAVAGPPDPFVPADIRDDIGDARLASANGAGWVTATGEVAGHWHTALDCDIDWGFVGVRIEAPPFDDEPVDHNMLLAVWSWSPEIADDIKDRGHATTAQTVVARARESLQMVLDDADHGRYQGIAPRGQPLAEHDNETIRFWMLLPESGEHNHDQQGPFTPIAYDLEVTAYQREVLPEAVGLFAHTETDHHAPLPGLGGNDAAVAWTGFEATLREGPRPDVTLNETWVH